MSKKKKRKKKTSVEGVSESITFIFKILLTFRRLVFPCSCVYLSSRVNKAQLTEFATRQILTNFSAMGHGTGDIGDGFI